MITDVESILRVCGIGTYLQIGNGNHSLVFKFLKRSIDAFGIDADQHVVQRNLERAPGRFFQGSLTAYPFQAESFDTIIIGSELLAFNENDLLVALNALTHLTKRNLVLYFSPETLKSIQPQSLATHRLFWERIAIQAGFRLHPRSMLVTPYGHLENERVGILTFFERVPKPAFEKFPQQWLSENRDTHADMLRESGRRADAAIARYVLAANMIRPGDVVLDAACGLGYGAAVLSACSVGSRFIGVDLDESCVAYANENFAATNPALSYQAADVTQLSFLADHSVDAVISFDTIEHLIDYEKFLQEVRRVLKPDGRFIGSVANLWCDASGNNPNPFHFHVFDWQKINAAISRHFIVDGRWAQTAGGGYKLPECRREMGNIPLDIQDQFATEWWIFTACGNPLAAADHPYTNPFHANKDLSMPAHVSFEKFYDNPWLYRVMVQLGERLTDKRVLSEFCHKVAKEARPGSADQGAALCVLAYQLLESENVTINELAQLVEQINLFDQHCDHKNLHAYRWAISLHYVGGRLLLAIGNREEALQAFLQCAAMDPLHFSPLLATKTISACMYSGLIYASYKKFPEAREQFTRGVKEAYRVLQGDWTNLLGDINRPLAFGLPEAAEVLDIASQCAQALHALEKQETVPGYFWDRINLKRFGLVEWNKNLEFENAMLRRQLVEAVK